ncbi:MAG TPA: SDR family NAD(P)-dependent oxidoreductase [Pirellulaceae bacterium]|nr:SDR family NAD(P)-dependent oxidoreductase [Pirellulaceae bacterium]HMO91728.1 SDR family NAD(P)-dependent oxidoreductase [Pirellulaceae bacterium]HMP69809.1 SDR family NAD(P)-dependent oxidoreductase [Pirellulaceae bacterium]
MKNWKEKVVLVTGGSAGLGFHIARQFGLHGAITVLLGRQQSSLQDACNELANEGIRAESVVADVTLESQVSVAIKQLIDKFSRLDVLVNNVGRSTRISLQEATVDEFRKFMEINFLSAVTCTRLAMPHLIKTDGHVVNIGSLAAKTAWPYLGPYSASKFALASYTHQLRLEGPKNMHYMLVCPGPVRRHDSGERYHSEAKHLPEQAKLPAAGAKVEGISPDVLAKKIVRGCERRWREIIFPLRARFLFTLLAYSPPLGDWLLRRMMRG